MLRTDTDSPTFEGGSLLPAATYLLMIGVLSALMFLTPGESPPPVLGMAWGIFLVALGAGVFLLEDVSPRSVLPSFQLFLQALGAVMAFWIVYHLVGFALAFGNLPGFTAAPSSAATHPALYLAAFGSSLVFTAFPEEFMFRGYLQPKLVAEAGGNSRRAVAVGVTVGAVLFALFHLPRWFLMAGHGVSPDLIIRLGGLVLAGLAFGLVYVLTNNLWLVALFHATMNQPPLLLTVDIAPALHPLVAFVEYTAIVLFVLVALFVTSPEKDVLTGFRNSGTSSPED